MQRSPKRGVKKFYEQGDQVRKKKRSGGGGKRGKWPQFRKGGGLPRGGKQKTQRTVKDREKKQTSWKGGN